MITEICDDDEKGECYMCSEFEAIEEWEINGGLCDDCFNENLKEEEKQNDEK